MRILVVEDEHKIANSIKKGLEQESYAVDVTYEGNEGFDLASTEDYDAIILDLLLPVELCVIFLDNAIKYSPQHSKVTLTSDKADGHILIHIKDQGIGIREEDIPHLFDRFYRSDQSRTKVNIPGYGLGLSIAKEIVDRHGGQILVQSKLNEGTTFIIRLPIKHTPKLV